MTQGLTGRATLASDEEATTCVDRINYRIVRPSTRPTAVHRKLWRSRSDLLAGWLLNEWKRKQSPRDKEV